MTGSGTRARRTTGLLTSLALAGAALAAPVSAGSPADFALEVWPGLTCVFGSGAGTTEYHLALRRPGVGQKSQTTVTSEANGFFDACFSAVVKGGDRIRVSLAGPPRTLLRVVAVPRLQAPVIDRNADRIVLAGDPGLALRLAVHRCAIGSGFNTSDCPVVLERNPKLKPNGTRAVNLKGTLNLRGHQFVMVRHLNATDDLFVRRANVPMLFIEVGIATSQALQPAGTKATIRLLKPNGALRGRAKVTGAVDGAVDFTFRKKGKATPVRVGNRVVASTPADASFVIPGGVTSIQAGFERVNGRCFPNQPFRVALGGTRVNGKVGADGRFSVIVSGVKADSSLRLACQTKGGDLVSFEHGPG